MSALALSIAPAASHPGDTPMYLLGQCRSGAWVLRDTTGTSAGYFLTREAALRFARLEKPGRPLAIVDARLGLEFDFAA